MSELTFKNQKGEWVTYPNPEEQIQWLESEVERLKEAITKAENLPISDVTQWVAVEDELPPLDVPVWVHGDFTFIGMRTQPDAEEGWLWANTYNTIWRNKEKWDADGEIDDDYNVTHWLPLPEPPCG